MGVWQAWYVAPLENGPSAFVCLSKFPVLCLPPTNTAGYLSTEAPRIENKLGARKGKGKSPGNKVVGTLLSETGSQKDQTAEVARVTCRLRVGAAFHQEEDQIRPCLSRGQPTSRPPPVAGPSVLPVMNQREQDPMALSARTGY